MEYSIKRFGDRNCQRIIDVDGNVVALAVRYCNDTWGIQGLNGEEIKKRLLSPKECLKWWIDLNAL